MSQRLSLSAGQPGRDRGRKRWVLARIPAQLPVLVSVLVMAFLVSVPSAAKKSKAKNRRAAADRAEIEATVRASTGNKEALAEVAVTLTGPGAELAATSDADGRFEIAVPAAAGSYRIHLLKDGFAPFDVDVELEAGQRYTYTFSLIDRSTGQRQDAAKAYNDGAARYQAGDMAGAKRQFLAALAADPQRVEAQLGLANVYLGEEDLAAAAAAIERFLAVRPDDLGAQRLAFEIYRRQGDLTRLEPLVAVFANGEQAANLAALIYNDGVAALKRQDEARAIGFFQVAHRLDPGLAEPLAGLATVQYNREDYAGLEHTLAELATVAPEHPRGHRLRFLLHDAQGKSEAALADFERYHQADAEGADELLMKRADLDFRGGRLRQARSALEHLLALEPDHARGHYLLGLVLASAEDLAGARQHLERFLALAPDDPEATTAREMLKHLGG